MLSEKYSAFFIFFNVKLKFCFNIRIFCNRTGNIIGELFIKLAVDYSIENKIDEIYLTHFITSPDFLLDLISEYGFEEVATLNQDGEKIFLKKLIYETQNKYTNIKQISKKYYPSFYDGKNVNKFIVPISPKCSTSPTGSENHLSITISNI